jgi:uncharacterized protein (DUF427 family)
MTQIFMKATWNGATLAESDETIVVEGNHYFPRAAIDESLFTKTDHTTVCPWKGTAHYYTVAVDALTNENAAWYYPDPKEAAEHITGYVAFWNGVDVAE